VAVRGEKNTKKQKKGKKVKGTWDGLFERQRKRSTNGYDRAADSFVNRRHLNC